jgi:hypothetical protein
MAIICRYIEAENLTTIPSIIKDNILSGLHCNCIDYPSEATFYVIGNYYEVLICNKCNRIISKEMQENLENMED